MFFQMLYKILGQQTPGGKDVQVQYGPTPPPKFPDQVGLDVLFGGAARNRHMFGVSSGFVGIWRIWTLIGGFGRQSGPQKITHVFCFTPLPPPQKKMNECSMKRDHFKTKKSYSFTMIFQSQRVFILYSLFLALKFHHHLFRNLTNIQIPNRQHPGDSIATNPRKGSPELPGQLLWSRNSEGIFPPESRILPSRSLGREPAVDKTSVRCPRAPKYGKTKF